MTLLGGMRLDVRRPDEELPQLPGAKPSEIGRYIGCVSAGTFSPFRHWYETLAFWLVTVAPKLYETNHPNAKLDIEAWGKEWNVNSLVIGLVLAIFLSSFREYRKAQQLAKAWKEYYDIKQDEFTTRLVQIQGTRNGPADLLELLYTETLERKLPLKGHSHN